MSENILIIKLSALGDFVQALGPMDAIRKFHPTAKLTLLTTKPFVDLAEKSGWFNEVLVDERPKVWNLPAVARLKKTLRDGDFKRVYDLQTSDRTGFYFKLFGKNKPEWSGIAKGCSHPHANAHRDKMHTVERQQEQLHHAGIKDVSFPNVDWMEANPAHFSLSEKFALLIPGGAPHRPDKRWPAHAYGEIAQKLSEVGIEPVIIGTDAEKSEAEEILKECPKAKSLLGKTSLFEIAALARKSYVAIGNDTGPTHLAAIAGAPTLALYSHASDPALRGQRGPIVDIMRVENLDQLSVEQVYTAAMSIADLSHLDK